jgi:hypothetical protein
MQKLHDILPLPVALSGEMERERERHEMESERISLSGHLSGVSNICVVGTICGQREATCSVRRSSTGRMPAVEHYGFTNACLGLRFIGVPIKIVNHILCNS